MRRRPFQEAWRYSVSLDTRNIAMVYPKILYKIIHFSALSITLNNLKWSHFTVSAKSTVYN